MKSTSVLFRATALTILLGARLCFGQQPVAHYAFSGNFSDAAGNLSNAVNQGAVFVADRFGNTNSALGFSSGQNATISGLGTVLSSNAVTVAGWFLFNPGVDAPMEWGFGFKSIVGGTESEFGLPAFRIQLSGSPNQYLVINPGCIQQYDTGYQLSLNQWHHLALTVSVGATRTWDFYVDGAAVFSGSNERTESLDFSYDFGVGGSIEGGSYYSGTHSSGAVSDVRFYNTALSESQVMTLAAIPEPAAYGGIIGMVVFIGVVSRRRRVANISSEAHTTANAA